MKKLLLSLSSIIAFHFANAQCNELFISEYVEGYNNNKALEIYNPKSTSVDLSNYRLIRWSNGSTTSDMDINYVQSLSGTIQPYSTFTFFLDKRDSSATGADTILESSLLTIANNIVNAGNGAFFSPNYFANVEGAKMMTFNGDDAISLQKNTGGWTSVDIFGVIGDQPTNSSGTTSLSAGWTDTAPYNDGQGAYLTKDKTLKRKPAITSGINSNPGFFNALSEWDSLSVGTYSNLGTHSCVCFTGTDTCNVTVYDTIFIFDTTIVTVYDTTYFTDTTFITVTDTIMVADTNYVSISVTDTLIINAILTGVLPPNNTNTIKIFPNPAKTHISINCGNINLMNNYSIKITNSLGQIVFQSSINQLQFYLDLSGWTGSGTYFVYIIDPQLNAIEIKEIVLQ